MSEAAEFERIAREVPGWQDIVADELRKLGYTVTPPAPEFRDIAADIDGMLAQPDLQEGLAALRAEMAEADAEAAAKHGNAGGPPTPRRAAPGGP